MRSIAVIAALGVAACGLSHVVRAEDAGLWDAHSHLSAYGEEAFERLAASGIVAVRDCGGDAAQLRQWRDEIAAGHRNGPRIYFSGPVIDGPKDAQFRLTVTTPEEARAAVDKLAALGVDFIKTHNAVPRDAYFAVLEQARLRGLPVASHLPLGVPAWEAAEAGVASIEHAAESLLASPVYAGYVAKTEDALAWWRSPDGDAAIARLAKSGVAITPTLVQYEAMTETRRGTDRYEPRRQALSFLIELTGRLHKAGIPLLAGSDFAWPDLPVVPGTSLLREMELLKQAGLTDAEARDAAGKNVAEWLTRKGRP